MNDGKFTMARTGDGITRVIEKDEESPALQPRGMIFRDEENQMSLIGSSFGYGGWFGRVVNRIRRRGHTDSTIKPRGTTSPNPIFFKCINSDLFHGIIFD